MALKDWKKVRNLKEELIFKNLKKGNYLRVVYNTYALTDNLKPLKEWNILGGDFPISRGFKTKTQALKYAKAYMRKH